VIGLFFSFLFALVLGTLAGMRPRGWADRFVSSSMIVTLAAPPFLVGILLVRLFTEEWDLLPGSGIAPAGTVGFHPHWQYLVMPVFVIAIGPAAILARYLRDALVTVLDDDYIRTARAKGLAELAVVSRHAIRNALIPVVSLLNTFIPTILGGSVIVESVFGLPGLGRVTTTAALSRDYPVVLTCVIFVAVVTLTVNLLIDLLYGVIDPRTRVS
jgi:peptide/nickel transport system permease protein